MAKKKKKSLPERIYRQRIGEEYNLITIFKMGDQGTKRLMDLLDSALEVSGFLQVKQMPVLQDYCPE